jgi:hypothetical protein
METCKIIRKITHHVPHDLHCLHVNLGTILIQQKNDGLEPKPFDSQLVTRGVASKAFLLQLNAPHQQHYGPSTLLTQHSQMF